MNHYLSKDIFYQSGNNGKSTNSNSVFVQSAGLHKTIHLRYKIQSMKQPISRWAGVFLLFTLLIISTFRSLHAQSPGFIVRPAAGPGSSVLNPNADAWTSSTTAGFSTSDITQSEIAYKIIRPIMAEPTGDLATGPSGGYSDIVKTLDNSGCYIFYDGTNLLFRIRIGGIVSGAKAYNVLFDTDMRLGATGSSPDPNYVPSTNSGNGNAGFEWEVALETGSSGRVAVYNVDGIINPAASFTYSLNTNHLVSAALTRESGNADYFYDFFVPASVLGITTTTPFRIVVTTNTNPGSAFQGTRSDIYGINDALFPNTSDAWEYAGNNTPGFTLNDVSSSGSGPGNVCTAAPVVNSGIGAGSNIVVSGTWTRLDADKPSSATIYIYKNGVLQGTTTCNTGGTWNYTVATIASGDVITAKALAAGESMCLLSNSVAATSCSPSSTSSTSSASFSATCVNDRRGMSGTKLANAAISIYSIAYNANPVLVATQTYPGPSPNLVTYGSPSNIANTTWEYNGTNNSGSTDPCSGGPNDIPNGSYYITVTESGKCESAAIFGSCVNTTTTNAPTITQTVLYAGSNTISGNSTEANPATIRLFVNGFIVASVNVAASAAYSFTNIVLQTGDVVSVRAQASGKCISNAASLTSTCFTAVPVITTDAQGNLTAGATAISGTSSSPNGTTIRVYQSPSALLGTTTVTNGTWSATVTALTNGSSYYATAQNGSCAVSAASSSATARTITTACPTITGSYAEGASPVNGTFAASFTGTVYLYQDGGLIGSSPVSGSTSWSITISSSNPLYAGGILTVGAQATGGTLNRACGSTTTVTCSAPAAPVVSPLSSTIVTGQSVTYTITGTQSGVLYSIQDASSGTSYSASKFGNGGNQTFTTNTFSAPGTYNISILADKLSGSSCYSSSSATIIVSNTLPVTWLSFTAAKQQQQVLLQWKTGIEVNSKEFIVQHSRDGISWNEAGRLNAAGNSNNETSYRFVHHHPHEGNNYYRILQTDIDGRNNFSRVIRLSLDNKDEISVYPNPVTDGYVNIQLPSDAIITLYNSSGVQTMRLSLNAGSHLLNLGRLPKGLYLLQAGTSSRRIMIQ